VVTYAAIDAANNKPAVAITAIGVPASKASCDPITNDKATGGGDHIGPNTKVKYSTVPPSTGPHLPQPSVSDRKFFTAEDRPAMEVLVHNLEHGYTVLWYDEKAGTASRADLESLAELANEIEGANGKVIVSSWDPSYGSLPPGKKFALSHWSATPGADPTASASQSGHRQLCGKLSGEVVKAFIEKFPSTSSPEPSGA
jgi:hypothetical protein